MSLINTENRFNGLGHVRVLPQSLTLPAKKLTRSNIITIEIGNSCSDGAWVNCKQHTFFDQIHSASLRYFEPTHVNIKLSHLLECNFFFLEFDKQIILRNLNPK